MTTTSINPTVEDIMDKYGEQFAAAFVFRVEETKVLYGPFESFKAAVEWAYENKFVGAALPVFNP